MIIAPMKSASESGGPAGRLGYASKNATAAPTSSSRPNARASLRPCRSPDPDDRRAFERPGGAGPARVECQRDRKRCEHDPQREEAFRQEVPAFAIRALQEVRRHEIDRRDADGGEGESVLGVVQHPRLQPEREDRRAEDDGAVDRSRRLLAPGRVRGLAREEDRDRHVHEEERDEEGLGGFEEIRRYERTPHMRPMSAVKRKPTRLSGRHALNHAM
jgi:hypothetical protein